MKIFRPRAAASCAAVVLWMFTSGCGAHSMSPGEAVADPSQPQGVTPGSPGTPDEGMAEVLTEAPILIAEREHVPLKPELAEVVELFETGAGEEIVRAYVSTSNIPYELTLEEIVYLRDLGIPDGVIAAMMRRGGELRAAAIEASALQTNLASAVDQLKNAFETASHAQGNGFHPDAVPEASMTEPVPAQGAEPPAEAPEPVQQFYSDLAPYGTWYQVPSYGWVWRPSVVVVNANWAPYRHGGRWLWTDQGWYWSSDYSWGWAPFHYGRWYSDVRLGWCWVPGSVWGPSWVTWRYTGGHVGWAPLPPACGWSSGFGLTWYGSRVGVGFGFGLSHSYYTFVPKGRFCYRNVGYHAVPHTEVSAVYQNSTVINNVIVGNNNTIVNQGVGYSKIASAVRGEVPKARIETLPSESTRPLRADRLDRSRDGMVIYKPTSIAQAGGRPPALRAEVRPAGATPTSSLVPGGRPSPSSTRLGDTTAGAIKPYSDPRGSAAAGTTGPSAVGTRPVAPSDRVGTPPGSAGTSRNVVGTPAPSQRATPSRSPATVTQPSPAPGRPGTIVTPQRQTTPVPLADPSRNIPAHLRPAVPQPVDPSRATIQTRPTPSPVVPSAPRSIQQYETPRPSAPVRTQPIPNINRPAPSFTPAPRQAPSAPTPQMRQPAPARQPITVPTAPTAVPRTAPSTAPVMTAPRPAVSAPSPARAPSTPAMSAPRPATSRPSVAPSAPTSTRGPAASPAAPRGRPN